MKYKRLTEKDEDIINCLNCPKYEQKCSPKDCIDIAYKRLAELEDKIETGTLIELPCKVGDTVYAHDKWGDRIVCGQLVNIELDHFGFTYMVLDNEYHQYVKCRELFLTKEEAEARLKELRSEV